MIAAENEVVAPNQVENRLRQDVRDNSYSSDNWKMPEWKDEYMPGPLLAESSFATLFPKYREKYLKEIWSIVTSALEKRGIGCELDIIEGSMTVRTTRKAKDPYAILKARDLIKLLSRSIPVQQAIKILDDGMECDIVKIGGMVRNRERFVKRRQRLVGPDGATLKALELITNCYILVQGNTVACMGSFSGLEKARKVIQDCMNNIHPVYNIKTLMIRRELAKDPKLEKEDWSRFLPTFKKKNVPRKKPKKVREKKAYTPFPPAPVPSKLDMQLESGEYFLDANQRKAKQIEERRKEESKKSAEKKRKRAEAYMEPKPIKDMKMESNTDDMDEIRRITESLKSMDKASKLKPQVDNISRFVSKS